MENPASTHFAPELHIPNHTFDISFYTRLGAKENFCLTNDDGSIHVAEFALDGTIFHVHEITRSIRALVRKKAKGLTSVIRLFVVDVAAFMQKAIDSWGTLVNPVTDHDYGYRQGMFQDPFGHYWQVQKKIS